MANASSLAALSFLWITRSTPPVVALLQLMSAVLIALSFIIHVSPNKSLYFVVLPIAVVRVTATLLGGLGDLVLFFCLWRGGNRVRRFYPPLSVLPFSIFPTTWLHFGQVPVVGLATLCQSMQYWTDSFCVSLPLITVMYLHECFSFDTKCSPSSRLWDEVPEVHFDFKCCQSGLVKPTMTYLLIPYCGGGNATFFSVLDDLSLEVYRVAVS